MRKTPILILVFFILLLLCCGTEPTYKLKRLQQDDVILALGDSLTSGVGSKEAASYPTVLEQLIGMKVINAGVPGAETKDSLEKIHELLNEYQPSLVIICLGGNDLLRKRPNTQIKENLKLLIKIIKESGAQVLLVAVPQPKLSLKPPSFYAELGKETKVPVDTVILPSLFANQANKSDYIHLNQTGYYALAKQIAERLKELGALPANN